MGLFALASFGKVLILLQYYRSVVSVSHALSLCGKVHYHTLTLKFSLKILYYSFFLHFLLGSMLHLNLDVCVWYVYKYVYMCICSRSCIYTHVWCLCVM